MILYGNPVIKYLENKYETDFKLHLQQKSVKVLVVGNNFASKVFTRIKKEYFKKNHINCDILFLDINSSFTEIKNHIYNWNKNPKVHGILVQLPLPSHLNANDVCNLIAPHKDIDCLNYQNLGLITQGISNLNQHIIPAAPAAVIHLLNYYQIPIKAARIVIINNSNLIGKPLAMVLTNYQATITILNKHSVNLSHHTKQADIIISATGVNNLITRNMINPQATLIDLGINYNEQHQIIGDIDFRGCVDNCNAITPTPGGIGKITITCLLLNLLALQKYKPSSEI